MVRATTWKGNACKSLLLYTHTITNTYTHNTLWPVTRNAFHTQQWIENMQQKRKRQNKKKNREKNSSSSTANNTSKNYNEQRNKKEEKKTTQKYGGWEVKRERGINAKFIHPQRNRWRYCNTVQHRIHSILTWNVFLFSYYSLRIRMRVKSYSYHTISSVTHFKQIEFFSFSLFHLLSFNEMQFLLKHPPNARDI